MIKGRTSLKEPCCTLDTVYGQLNCGPWKGKGKHGHIYKSHLHAGSVAAVSPGTLL